MLREFTQVRQEPGGGHRRWFEADGLDLIVWFGADQAVLGFQLCYDLGSGEHALTWRPDRDLLHSQVDAGEAGGIYPQTPILAPAGPVPWAQLVPLFDRESGSLDPALRTLVKSKLTQGSQGKQRPEP